MTDTRKTELLDKLRRIDNSLSPEVLTCDGELRPNEVRRRAAILHRDRNDVIAQLGYTPTDKELYNL
jgi:hypothetical protein